MKLYDRWPLTVTMGFVLVGVVVLLVLLYLATVVFGKWAMPIGMFVALFLACVFMDVRIRRRHPPP